MLKPGGRVYVREAVAATRPKAGDSLRSAMKLAGFIDISQVSSIYCAARREFVQFQRCSDFAPLMYFQSTLCNTLFPFPPNFIKLLVLPP